MQEAKVAFTLSLDSDLAEAIKRYSVVQSDREGNRVSYSEIIRRALYAYLRSVGIIK